MGRSEHAAWLCGRSHRLEGLHPAAALFQADLRTCGTRRRSEAAVRPYGDVGSDRVVPRSPPLRPFRKAVTGKASAQCRVECRHRPCFRTPCRRSNGRIPTLCIRVFGSPPTGATSEKFTDELLKDSNRGILGDPALGNKAVNTDVLGDAYEYLVGKFADVTRRNKAGEFYTPRSVVRMMVEMLDPKGGASPSTTRPAARAGCCSAQSSTSRGKGGDPSDLLSGRSTVRRGTSPPRAIARMNLVSCTASRTSRSPERTHSATPPSRMRVQVA